MLRPTVRFVFVPVFVLFAKISFAVGIRRKLLYERPVFHVSRETRIYDFTYAPRIIYGA